jgi:putative MATE family efflux protein
MHSGAPPRLLALTWPLLAELVLGMGVGIAGLWLASRTSDSAAAAFALSGHVLNAFFLLFRVVSMGVSVVVTQDLGAGNRAGAERTARAALGASTWVGAAVAIGVLATGGTLLAWLGAGADVLAVGVPFLQALAPALLFDAYNASLSAVLRAHLRTREAMLNVLAMHALHLALCVPLMHGAGPIPALGLPGFAVAMALSRLAGIAIHLWLWQRTLGMVPRWRDAWALHLAPLRPVLRIGVPGAAESIAYRLAMLASLAAVARGGTGALATHGYASQLMNLVVLASLSLGFAGEILIGHQVGAGRLREAHRTLRRCLGWALGLSVGLALLIAVTAPLTLRLFTRDPAIVASASLLLWITVVLEPGRTCNVVVINALRATGDARFPVQAGIASMAIVMAGGSWLLGVHYGLGLVGVWIAYALDEWVRGVIMVARWHSLAWTRQARASRRRATGPARTPVFAPPNPSDAALAAVDRLPWEETR